MTEDYSKGRPNQHELLPTGKIGNAEAEPDSSSATAENSSQDPETANASTLPGTPQNDTEHHVGVEKPKALILEFSNSAKLGRGLRGLFQLLHSHNVGDVVTEAEVLARTRWGQSSLKTYERKNKLAHLLARRIDGRFDVLRGGPGLQPADIQNALSQVTPEPLQLKRGEPLRGEKSNYVLVERLGAGAVGHVWKAIDANGSEVAIKIVNPRADLLEPAIFTDVKHRFRREVRNPQKIDHPSIVKHLDYGEHRGHPFSVLELARQSMKDLLTTGALPVPEAAKAIVRVALGLQVLHAIDCIHRDVKPGNILETSRGWVLADMGITKWSDLNEQFTSAGTITYETVQLGSVNYMSPEQREDAHKITPASDVYSLGVTWYELLTGKIPSPQRFAAGRCDPPSDSAELNDFIRRMTSYDASDRPTIEEVIEMAQRFELAPAAE